MTSISPSLAENTYTGRMFTYRAGSSQKTNDVVVLPVAFSFSPFKSKPGSTAWYTLSTEATADCLAVGWKLHHIPWSMGQEPLGLSITSSLRDSVMATETPNSLCPVKGNRPVHGHAPSSRRATVPCLKLRSTYLAKKTATIVLSIDNTKAHLQAIADILKSDTRFLGSEYSVGTMPVGDLPEPINYERPYEPLPSPCVREVVSEDSARFYEPPCDTQSSPPASTVGK
jgi:hypothetical protein